MMKRPAPDRSVNERQRLRAGGGLEAVREDALRVLSELHYDCLDVLTSRAFKGPQVVPRLLRFNARQIHLRRALLAIRTRVNRRVF
jgi:hypothetical protein